MVVRSCAVSASVLILPCFLSLTSFAFSLDGGGGFGNVQPQRETGALLAQGHPGYPAGRRADRGPSTSTYAVESLTLGSRAFVGTQAHRKYQCSPSKQFTGFTWCSSKGSESEPRGNFEVSRSILHSENGTIVYVNRFQVPAYWGPTEVINDINRHARKIGAQPNIITMPERPGLPKGTLATWGMVRLEPLDRESVGTLAQGKAIRKGLLTDYIGNFVRSAREGLPIYRISGGAGFVWVASHDESGRGTLRFFAVDASTFSATEHEHPASPPAQSAPLSPPIPTQQATPETVKPQEESAHLAYAKVTSDVLEKNQLVRDALFNNLQTTAKQYTFEYVVINLPAGTLPGISVPIPVSYVRYNSTVFFAFGHYSLEPGAEDAIADFVKTILKDKTYRSVLIVGHTDSIGTDEYNYNLSKNRAVTVATALRNAGIPESHLGIVPMGEAQPFKTNETPQGRALNRRVEFFISDIPDAPRKAIEQIKYNPCHRNNHGPVGDDCAIATTRVPILSSSGQPRPGAEIDLTRTPLPSSSGSHDTAGLVREALPNDVLQRPSLGDFQPER